ncbi:exodeoxyribonuclease III [Neoactinobaculum massilliense]|uniref:exodeoxyribonuclease III n=1 Tax=Neoactinobaculum massilliense TaxID=2364794 RepID=UPI000F51D1B1|nr:exodeoxyribonuclease III [Neoactinobaculum massilliense]
MRIATWNINSVRTRFERALGVLKRWDLDVLLLQETKCKPEQFPREPFEQAGYQVEAIGLDQWNGVAVISRVGITDVATQFPGQPAFAKLGADGAPVKTPVVEARALGATVGTTRVWSLYVPNGRAVTDPHYRYKLDFLNALQRSTAAALAEAPEQRLLLAGDWNVAPRDEDVWDPAYFRDNAGGLYITDAEREHFAAFSAAGMREVTRDADGAAYTFWDYQKLRFPRNEGMRIDFGWASPHLADALLAAHIDRDERKGKKPSDHVPVIMEFAE